MLMGELIEWQTAVTPEQRQQDIINRQNVVDGMLRWIAGENREPNQLECERLQHHRTVIASLKQALEANPQKKSPARRGWA